MYLKVLSLSTLASAALLGTRCGTLPWWSWQTTRDEATRRTDIINNPEIDPDKTVELPPTMKRRCQANPRIVRTFRDTWSWSSEEGHQPGAWAFLYRMRSCLTNRAALRLNPGSTTWSKIVQGLPTDSTILKNTNLKLLDGTPADISAGIYKHHVVFFDTFKLCFNSPESGKPDDNTHDDSHRHHM